MPTKPFHLFIPQAILWLICKNRVLERFAERATKIDIFQWFGKVSQPIILEMFIESNNRISALKETLQLLSPYGWIEKSVWTSGISKREFCLLNIKTLSLYPVLFLTNKGRLKPVGRSSAGNWVATGWKALCTILPGETDKDTNKILVADISEPLETWTYTHMHTHTDAYLYAHMTFDHEL